MHCIAPAQLDALTGMEAGEWGCKLNMLGCLQAPHSMLLLLESKSGSCKDLLQAYFGSQTQTRLVVLVGLGLRGPQLSGQATAFTLQV